MKTISLYTEHSESKAKELLALIEVEFPNVVAEAKQIGPNDWCVKVDNQKLFRREELALIRFAKSFRGAA